MNCFNAFCISKVFVHTSHLCSSARRLSRCLAPACNHRNGKNSVNSMDAASVIHFQESWKCSIGFFSLLQGPRCPARTFENLRCLILTSGNSSRHVTSGKLTAGAKLRFRTVMYGTTFSVLKSLRHEALSWKRLLKPAALRFGNPMAQRLSASFCANMDFTALRLLPDTLEICLYGKDALCAY